MASPLYVTLAVYARMAGTSRQTVHKRLGKDIERVKGVSGVILIDITEYPPEYFKLNPRQRTDLIKLS